MSEAEFGQLRPRLKVLLALHGQAATEDARARIAADFERLFLETAWHAARDLLDNGYEPVMQAPASRGARGRLKLVDSVDAA